MQRLVYFITHPNVIIDPLVPITEWSLSNLGKMRTEKLLRKDWTRNIGSMYCSKEKKSIDTAEIIRDRLGLDYTIVSELGEVDRSVTGYLPPNEHKISVELFYAQPEKSILGREKAIDAQIRIINAVNNILNGEIYKDKDIVIISHGAVASLLYAHLQKSEISIQFNQPDAYGGCYFAFDSNSYQIALGWNKFED